MAVRRLGVAAGLIALCCVATACSTSSSARNRTWSIVALGDSVPRGTNCDCRPYPPLTADKLAASSGQTVNATNDSVAGATSSDVLEQLTSDRDVTEQVSAADVVEIEVGANDVAHTSRCGSDVSCYTPRIPAIEQNLAAVVRRVHELTSRRHVLVVLLDYWSVWLGGTYAQAQGAAYVAAAEEMTDEVNAVIKSTAAKSGSAYVDLRAAFKGPDYAYDETHYLSNDGDHPNAVGHERIATAAEAVIEQTGFIPTG
ncbi:MAG TPA: SGNH/GDSL hydrolase family protein [Gaiellaceae bacterium]|nr:SGNH/GDSL hydrolase family protein [Gaiellaceae bacterium]